MTRTSKALALFAVAALATGAGLGFWMRASEPEYGGKPLRFWLKIFCDTKPVLRQRPGVTANFMAQSGVVFDYHGTNYFDAREALRNLGSLAAPDVARALAARDSKFMKVYVTFKSRLPPYIAQRLPEPNNADMIRNRAYLLLKEMGPAAATAVPQLSRFLSYVELQTQCRGAEILGCVGSRAESAVPALISALNHTNGEVRAAAAVALGKIGLKTPETVSALQTALRSKRLPALIAVKPLHDLGYKANEAVPELTILLEKNDEYTQVQACAALSLIGSEAVEAVPTLVGMLRGPESRIRAKAGATLGQIGRGAFTAVPALTELLRDEWWYVRENAAVALGRIGTSTEQVQSALGQLAQDPNQDVRASASEALDRIKGPYRSRSSLP